MAKKTTITNIAGAVWLLAAFLVAIAAMTAQADREPKTELSQGVTLGSPIRG